MFAESDVLFLATQFGSDHVMFCITRVESGRDILLELVPRAVESLSTSQSTRLVRLVISILE